LVLLVLLAHLLRLTQQVETRGLLAGLHPLAAMCLLLVVGAAVVVELPLFMVGAVVEVVGRVLQAKTLSLVDFHQMMLLAVAALVELLDQKIT
jgi:hypothetical protein